MEASRRIFNHVGEVLLCCCVVAELFRNNFFKWCEQFVVHRGQVIRKVVIVKFRNDKEVVEKIVIGVLLVICGGNGSSGVAVVVIVVLCVFVKMLVVVIVIAVAEVLLAVGCGA